MSVNSKLHDCSIFPQREDGSTIGNKGLDFVKAFYQLDLLSRKSGKEEVPVAELIPAFQDFVAAELGTDQISFGDAYQLYEKVIEQFNELKKKLSVPS